MSWKDRAEPVKSSWKDRAIKEDSGYWSDVKENAKKELKDFKESGISMVKHPIKTLESLSNLSPIVSMSKLYPELLTGTPPKETTAYKNLVEMPMEALKSVKGYVTDPKESFRKRPIQMSVDVASIVPAIGQGTKLVSKSMKIPGMAGISEKIANNLKNISAREAVRGSLLQKSNLKRLAKSGISQEEAGKFLLDQGVVQPFSTIEGRLEKIQGIKEGAGKTIGNVGETLDRAGINEFDPLKAAIKLEEEAIPYRGKESFSSISNQYEKGINDILNMGEKGTVSNVGVKSFEKPFKETGYKRGIPTESGMIEQDVARSVEKEYVDSIGRGAEKMGDTSLKDRYLKAKQTYGPAAQLERELEDVKLANQGRRSIGLTDFIVGAGELGASGSIPKAGALVGIKKGIENIYHPIAASVTNKASNIFSVT